MFIKQISHYTL